MVVIIIMYMYMHMYSLRTLGLEYCSQNHLRVFKALQHSVAQRVYRRFGTESRSPGYYLSGLSFSTGRDYPSTSTGTREEGEG